MVNNLLISIEGVECTGKSSVAAELASRLADEGLAASLAPEFASVPLQGLIDAALSKSIFISESIEGGPNFALPFMLLHEVVKIEESNRTCDVTILDRSFDSVAVYQGAFLTNIAQPGGVVGLHSALTGFLAAAGLPTPQRTYLLDAPTNILARRYQKREGQRLPGAYQPWIERLRELFRQISASSPRIVRLDATNPIDALADTILEDIVAIREAKV